MRRTALLALILAGCATAPPRTDLVRVRIDNQTPETLRVYVDGYRTATVMPRQHACITLPRPTATLSYGMVGQNGRREAYLPKYQHRLRWTVLGTHNDQHTIRPGPGC